MLTTKNGDILNATENFILHQVNENWMNIKQYEGLYQVSSLGRVKSFPRNGTIGIEKIIKPTFDKYGYLQVILCNKNHKCFRIHRLVAEMFIPNPQNKDTVNHIDGNKLNNNIRNLEWNSIEENNDNAYILKLNKKTPILQFDKNNNFIKSWDSLREIERVLGFNHSNILQCCKNKYKQMNGFIWRFDIV